MKKKLLLFAFSLSLLSIPLLSLAKTGSYSLTWTGTAPAGTKISVRAVAEDGTTYEEEFSVNGQTPEQARNTILTDMQNAGWVVSANGTNGIIVTGHSNPPNPVSAIKEIGGCDMNADASDATIKLDGTVSIIDAPPPAPQEFSFSFTEPFAGTTPGNIELYLGPTLNLVCPLVTGDTPVTAATKLESAMTAAGLVVSRVDHTVTFDRNNPVNSALLTDPLHIEFGVTGGFAGSAAKLTLAIKVLVIPTLSQWGVIILGMMLLLMGSVFLIRKSRYVPVRS